MFENSKWINYVIEKESNIKKYEPSPYIAKTFLLKEKPVNVKANLHGIKVEYDKNSIKIDSPYSFTLKLKNSVKHLDMGKYEFSLY